MNDIRTYISDALEDSIYACDKDSLDYYYRCPEAADYFASFTDGEKLYKSDCYFCEDTEICTMEEVEEIWDDVLKSVLIDFALSNMSDDDLEEGTITEEWTEEFDEDKCVSLGNVFVGYELPKYAVEVLDQTWDLCGFSEEHGAVYAIQQVLGYLYNEGKIGSGKDEIPLAGVAKFFGATHVAFLEETEVHGAIYSYYKFNYKAMVENYEELHDYELLREDGRMLAKYNKYYSGTNMIDTSIEWYFIFGRTYMYVSDENTAYPDGCLESWQAGYDVHEDGYPLVDGDYGYWEEIYDFDKDELHIKSI